MAWEDGNERRGGATQAKEAFKERWGFDVSRDAPVTAGAGSKASGWQWERQQST